VYLDCLWWWQSSAAIREVPASRRSLPRGGSRRAGHSSEQLKVGVHAIGYVTPTLQEAVEEFGHGYIDGMSKAGEVRAWGRVTRAHFDAERGPDGALIVGGPDEVIDKIRHYDDVPRGISRQTFQMDWRALPHAKLMRTIEILGTRVSISVRSNAAAVT
jgi:alkanesulfonate monooxygenase SsuD/methylene tetrahydromethanopterin reductase-like flavin-dependent oxidoreductase (luciferase family)